MEPEKKVEGVEIDETPEVAAAPAPTLDDLAAEGFGQQELKDAKELGLVTEKTPEERRKRKRRQWRIRRRKRPKRPPRS